MLNRRDFIKLCAGSLVVFSATTLFLQSTANAACYEIPVLLYHRVGYTAGGLTVTPEQLSNDLNYLANYGYTSISLEQFKSFILDRPAILPDKPVLITFDDGYLDNYENAFPILQNYSMLGTFFIITGLLWDHPDRMGPKHIIEMAGRGMSFGSHTVSHRALAEMPEEEIRRELMESKTTLESITGQTIDVISYPCGSYNQTVINIAKEQGYTVGVTVRNGRSYADSPDFEVRRIPVFGYDGSVAAAFSRRG